MQRAGEAIFLRALGHGEHAAIARLFMRCEGVVATYVHGGQSRRSRALLSPGNLLFVDLTVRAEGRMPQARLELLKSRSAFAFDPLRLALVEWVASLIADTLPEQEAHEDLYDGLSALLSLMDTEASTEQLGSALAHLELALLRDLGFRLDLTRCAATGDTNDLAYVSPRTGRAVGREAGAPFAERMFALPAFLHGGSAAPAPGDAVAALRLTRHFIERDLLSHGRGERLAAARDRVDARLAALS